MGGMLLWTLSIQQGNKCLTLAYGAVGLYPEGTVRSFGKGSPTVEPTSIILSIKATCHVSSAVGNFEETHTLIVRAR